MPEAALDTPPAGPEVIIERAGALGILRLNRSKALNSLTLTMVRLLSAALDEFAADPAIGLVLIEGEGERGLCAGGDIRALYESAKKRDGAAALFLGEEYVLNARIAHFPKPYIAFMDGLVMGGGVGVSAHGSHRIVTEKTRLAMPETGIGFVPDVGGTWLLAHTPGESGTYLGLLGETMGAPDAIYTGIADAMVPAADLPKLREALASLGPQTAHEAVRETIRRFAQTIAPGPLEQHQLVIGSAMQSDRVEDIVLALEADGSDFAKATLKTISAKSPTSLKLTLRLLRSARTALNLETCLLNEYRAAVSMVEGHDDFVEGVRAAVIDKDRQPRWLPAGLKDVDEAALDTFFLPKAGEPAFYKQQGKTPGQDNEREEDRVYRAR